MEKPENTIPVDNVNNEYAEKPVKPKKHRKLKKVFRWLKKPLGKVLSLAVSLALIAVIALNIGPILSLLLPRASSSLIYQTLVHETSVPNELIVRRESDTASLTKSYSILGVSYMNITTNYHYEIGLGFQMNEIKLEQTDNVITVTVPDCRVLYDSFEPLGTPDKNDFFNVMDENIYQKILDEQHALCRAGYENDPAYIDGIWDDACALLTEQFEQILSAALDNWDKNTVRFDYVRPGKTE